MKKLMAVLLVLVMLLGMVACGDNNDADTDVITLNVAYMPNWGALWAVAAADELGYFAEEGIEINLVQFEDGPTEIAAMESGEIDISYIGAGAHRLCSTGNAKIITLQHLDNADAVIGLNGITSLDQLAGKTIGYAAGTSSETILLEALASVGLTMDDVNALSMDATALTTAAMAGSVDAVAAWSPYTLTIMEEMGDNAVKLCQNIDFEGLVSPASWVVNPKWADENEETIVKFLRAILKGMDYGSDSANFEQIAEWQAAIISSTAEVLLEQQYDGDWLDSERIAGYLESGEMLDFYQAQQNTFVANGVFEADGLLTPEEFVLTDLLEQALAE